ncbi:hypothetical protein ITI46_27335 [Streptomyces oryzae]|uniref:Uncharacterized protein n=1 Tax=Streptomyces oryzae TaxID=1434886 RepID=A0ABS3XIY2_9ACTN|nr:hypothetical protein [Streptomyces oryzae]MBO8195334.1 hypothetical protein [Streptomyces oryzae]
MLYDLSNSQHQLRMDDLRREAEHARLVRAAKAAVREQRRAARPARSWFGRRPGKRDDEEPVWVPAA